SDSRLPFFFRFRGRRLHPYIPGVIDVEISGGSLSGLDAEGCATLPQIEFSSTSLKLYVNSIQTRHDRQNGALKLDCSHTGFQVADLSSRFASELSTQIAAWPIQRNPKGDFA